MMIVMKETATEDEIGSVVEKIERAGALAHRSQGARVTIIGAIGDVEQDASVESLGLEGQPGVDRVVPILKPYKLASSQMRHGERTVLDIEGRKIGGEHFALIAGPCTVETREQTLTTAEVVKDAGAALFRGGAYKPRTSPYAFQGLGQEGLRLLAEAKEQSGLPIVTELMDMRDLEPVLEVADVIQIGARNMQNYPLLAEVGRSGRPVLLKRGLSSTLDELLMAAEYILKEGNPNVMLCERGIRTFETAYRFTLDLKAVPVLKELSHLPVIVDPSHAAGGATLCRRCRWRRPPPGPMGSSSRCTRTPTRPSATAHRRCWPTSSPTTRRQWRAPRRSRGRCSPPREVRPDTEGAVLGVGLIGGSIGLAARRRPGAYVVGYDGEASALSSAVELGAIDEPAFAISDAVRDADVVFVATPVGAATDIARAGSGGGGLRLRGQRCRLDQARDRRRDLRPAFRRRPSAGGRRDRRRGRRARGPVRGRHLVSHARRRSGMARRRCRLARRRGRGAGGDWCVHGRQGDGSRRCRAVGGRAPARSHRAHRRAARCDRARRPRPPDGERLAPTARARQRLVAQALRAVESRR